MACRITDAIAKAIVRERPRERVAVAFFAVRSSSRRSTFPSERHARAIRDLRKPMRASWFAVLQTAALGRSRLRSPARGGISFPRSVSWQCKRTWATTGAMMVPVKRNASAWTPHATSAPPSVFLAAFRRNSRYPRWCTRITNNAPITASVPEATPPQSVPAQPRASAACQTASTGSVASKTASAVP